MSSNQSAPDPTPVPTSGATVAALDLDKVNARRIAMFESLRSERGLTIEEFAVLGEDMPALFAEVRQSRETAAALQADVAGLEGRLASLETVDDAIALAEPYAVRAEAAEARADALQAELDDVRGVLRLRSAAHDRVIAERDALAEQVAKGLRLIDGITASIEGDCQPCGGMCHDYDTTDDDECALIADLSMVRAALDGGQR